MLGTTKSGLHGLPCRILLQATQEQILSLSPFHRREGCSLEIEIKWFLSCPVAWSVLILGLESWEIVNTRSWILGDCEGGQGRAIKAVRIFFSFFFLLLHYLVPPRKGQASCLCFMSITFSSSLRSPERGLCLFALRREVSEAQSSSYHWGSRLLTGLPGEGLRPVWPPSLPSYRPGWYQRYPALSGNSALWVNTGSYLH